MPRISDNYPFRSPHRGLEGPMYYYFETNSTSTPDGAVDDASVVRSIARSSAGKFLITLNDTYSKVYAQAHLEEPASYRAYPSAKSAAGSGSGSTVTISVVDLTNVELDTNDQTVCVVIYGQR